MNTRQYLQEFIDEILNEELTGNAANRAAFIKSKVEPLWDKLPGNPGLPGYKEIDPWLEAVAAADPTVKKSYMQWIATRSLKNPAENKTEDYPAVHDCLQGFEANKARIANKDINTYKNFHELFAVVLPLLTPREKTPEEKAKEKEDAKLNAIKAEIETVYTGPEGWIRIPKTERASQYLGQNTTWCTAYTNRECRFNSYNSRDVLFVVYIKATKERFQIHIDNGEYSDIMNKNHGDSAMPPCVWDPIIKWYKAHNPDLGIKHLMSLQKHSEENLAAGTTHAGLMDLMKLYDV